MSNYSGSVYSTNDDVTAVSSNQFEAFANPPVPEEAAGPGLRELSEVATMAEKVAMMIEKDVDIGGMIGTIKQTLLHKKPAFVGELKGLTAKIEWVAQSTSEPEFFVNIEIYRMDKAIETVKPQDNKSLLTYR